MIAVLMGIIIGLISSFLSWFILFHVLVPKLVFSDYISRSSNPDAQGRHIYKIKYGNFSRRGILDLELIAQLRVQGIIPGTKDTWLLFYPTIRNNRLPYIQPIPKGGVSNLANIALEFRDDSELERIPENLKQSYIDGTLRLEDLLSAGNDAHLLIFAFGYDSFTGARKLFQSRKYKTENIQPFAFKSGESLELDRESDKKAEKI